MLVRHRAERVVLDARALFSRGAPNPATEAAQAKKPRVPARFVGLSDTPIVRFIGRDEPAECDPQLDAWAGAVARWVGEGRTPFVFCHAPDERFAPALCRRFHAHLRGALPSVESLPDWPLPPGETTQLSLL